MEINILSRKLFGEHFESSILGPVYKDRGLPWQVGYRSTRTYLLSHHCVYKAARVTRVSKLPYLHARVTLSGGLTFPLVNSPGRVDPPTRVNFLIVSRPLVYPCIKLSRVVELPYLSHFAFSPGLSFALQLGLICYLG